MSQVISVTEYESCVDIKVSHGISVTEYKSCVGIKVSQGISATTCVNVVRYKCHRYKSCPTCLPAGSSLEDIQIIHKNNDNCQSIHKRSTTCYILQRFHHPRLLQSCIQVKTSCIYEDIEVKLLKNQNK